MAILRIKSILSILLLSYKVLALQVSPNSPCASVCLDDSTADASDPNSSNTYPTDIVCSNADYDSTPAGKKFEACTDCLRNSTSSSSGEDDQSWFLYNLRYALDMCLFGFPNSSSSDAQTTPCSTDHSCGPLRESLENGDLVPANESSYSYCSANSNALLSSSLSDCIGCFQDSSDESYLANFLVALQAGCLQQPVTGMNIGIRGNIFSSNLINITYPGDNKKGTTHKKGLTQATIIGIVIGVVFLTVIAVAVIFICYRKQRNAKSMKQLTPLDSRFRSKTISSLGSSSNGNPYGNPPIGTSQELDLNTLSPKELRALGHEMPNFSKLNSSPRVTEEQQWQDAHAHFEATQGQLPTYTAMPAHLAYIPTTHSSNSPTTSTNTNSTYQVSPYASPRSSPKNLPPPIKVPQARGPPPREVHASEVQPVDQPVAEPLERRVSKNQRSQPAPGFPPDRHPRAPEAYPGHPAQDPYRILINTKVQAATGLPRVPTPQDGNLPQFPPRPTVTPQTNQLAQFRPHQQESSSRITPPGLHSQKPTYQPAALSAPDDRPPSQAGKWKRSGSHRAARESSMERTTAGDWKRNGSRGRFRESSTERSAVPVRISGPMIRHGGRFDFEVAEQEMREREETTRKGPDATPSSAESQEQWPGSY